MNILVLDYGMGNISSVHKKIINSKDIIRVSSDRSDIKWADKIILVGVGHFKNAMKNLKNLNLLDDLNDFALIKKKLTLGICLGMQIMCDFSEEGNVSGLGWVNAKIKKFTTDNKLQFKIPHVGWNQIKIAKKNDLFNGIEESSEFYFVHSYFAEPQNKSIILNKTNYIHEFCSAFQKENIIGVQYHPEKSHDAGEIFLKNFLNL
ncbi:MAG: imidazole glycerol phosphate synthase subunit HisH [Pelagibacteraceae bacterium]|nr:imidazole glycerol phosphate synthase subunit HisH [Pelagibacteraceae bacterium]